MTGKLYLMTEVQRQQAISGCNADETACATSEAAIVMLQSLPLVQGEPAAYRFTQNRGNGKTEFTYHDNTPQNDWRKAYPDNCLEITKLYTHPPAPLRMLSEDEFNEVSCHIPTGKDAIKAFCAKNGLTLEKL